MTLTELTEKLMNTRAYICSIEHGLRTITNQATRRLDKHPALKYRVQRLFLFVNYSRDTHAGTIETIVAHKIIHSIAERRISHPSAIIYFTGAQ